MTALQRIYGKIAEAAKRALGVARTGVKVKPLTTEPLGHTGTVYPGEQEAFDPTIEPGTGGEEIGAEDVQAFLRGQKVYFVDSSNMKYMHYFPKSHEMEFGFKNGSSYMVDPISQDEAMAFIQAASKGRRYWDIVRIRGTRLGHKKNYRKLHGLSRGIRGGRSFVVRPRHLRRPKMGKRA